MNQTSELRRGRLASAVVVGALVFVVAMSRHQPIESWLFFRYLRATLLAALFAATCLVAGHAVVVRVLRRVLPFEEHFAIALRSAFSFSSLPASSLDSWVSMVCRSSFSAHACSSGWARETSFAPSRDSAVTLAGRDLRLSLDPLRGAILAFGGLGVLQLWFTILTPQNASYDARWRHLPIAEHYVAQGGIARFGEGWVNGAQPQLASLLYSWAFSRPGAVFDRVETAAHMELAIFLATLVGVAAIARDSSRAGPAVVGGVVLVSRDLLLRLRSGLGARSHCRSFRGAHLPFGDAFPRHAKQTVRVAARCGRRWRARHQVHGSDLASAPARRRCLYGASAPPSRRRFPRGFRAALTALAIAIFTAPHWLRNTLYLRRSAIPGAEALAPVASWSPAADAPYESDYLLFRPPLSVAGIYEMLKTLATFSFIPT